MVNYGFDMLYDVGDFIAKRPRHDLPLSEFLEQTGNGALFLIEYIDVDDNNEHAILWCRHAKADDSFLHVCNARLFDDTENPLAQKASNCAVAFDKLLAMRLNTRRYNWNNTTKIFIEE